MLGILKFIGASLWVSVRGSPVYYPWLAFLLLLVRVGLHAYVDAAATPG